MDWGLAFSQEVGVKHCRVPTPKVSLSVQKSPDFPRPRSIALEDAELLLKDEPTHQKGRYRQWLMALPWLFSVVVCVFSRVFWGCSSMVS